MPVVKVVFPEKYVTLASRIETSNQTTRQYSNPKLQSRMRTDNSACATSTHIT